MEDYSLPEGKEFTAEREMVDGLQGRCGRTKPRRAQVINESLVREALEGIGLEQWKGCQIIDMNPGRCAGWQRAISWMAKSNWII